LAEHLHLYLHTICRFLVHSFDEAFWFLSFNFPGFMRSKAFLHSLLVTSTLSFMVPIILISAVVMTLFLIMHIPIAESISQAMVQQVLQVLMVFGTGNAIEGAIVIATTCSVVGILFDTYAFCNGLRNG
jgi:hypothetical protein